MPELDALRFVVFLFQAQLGRLRNDERGTTLEVVLISAALAGAALVAGAVLVARVTDTANSIPTGPVPTP